MPSESAVPGDERVRTVIVHVDKQYRAEHVKGVSDPFTVDVGKGRLRASTRSVTCPECREQVRVRVLGERRRRIETVLCGVLSVIAWTLSLAGAYRLVDDFVLSGEPHARVDLVVPVLVAAIPIVAAALLTRRTRRRPKVAVRDRLEWLNPRGHRHEARA